MSIKVSTWNVNSIRARFTHFVEFVNRSSPDIILIQEVRCDEKSLPLMEIENMGYNVAYSLEAGRNGTMILSKYRIDDVECVLPDKKFVEEHFERFGLAFKQEQRFTKAIISLDGIAVNVISLYAPNGGQSALDIKNDLHVEKSERYNYKLSFYKDLSNYLSKITLPDEYVIIAGDYNIAMAKEDLYNPVEMEGSVCFTEMERGAIGSILNDNGYIDAFRAVNGPKVEFTWWDYRVGSFKQNKGMRIDYIFASKNITKNLKSCIHETYYRKLQKPSDHCPVTAVFDF